MDKAKSETAEQKTKPWWRYRRNRNKVWLGLFGALGAAAVALFIWFATQGASSPKAPEAGKQVQAFQLPEVVSGTTFSLADSLGKKDIVIVSYMGFF